MSDERFSPELEQPKAIEHDPMREQWDAYYEGTLAAMADRTTFVHEIQKLIDDSTYDDRHEELKRLHAALVVADMHQRAGQYMPIVWPERFNRTLFEKFIATPAGEKPPQHLDAGLQPQTQVEAPSVVIETFAQPENPERPFEKEVKAEIVNLLGKVESIDGLLQSLTDMAEQAPGAAMFRVMSDEKRDEIIHQVAQAKLQIEFFRTPQPDQTQVSPDGPFSVGDIVNLLSS